MAKPALEPSSWKQYYEPVGWHSPLEVESRLFAIDLFEQAKLHKHLIRSGSITDEDVLRLLGFVTRTDEDAGTLATLRQALRWQRRRLRKALTAQPSRQTANLRELCDYLHFSETEHALVHLALMAAQSEAFSDIMCLTHGRCNYHATLALLARTLGMPPAKLKAALRPDAGPMRTGLIDSLAFELEDIPQLPGNIRFALECEPFDVQTFLRRLIRPAPEPELEMADFAHVEQLSVLCRYLAHACGTGSKGVNILLHGAPGTGKTELGRALAKHVGSALHEVPNENDEGEPISGGKRFAAFAMCQHILAQETHAAVLFDEVEDVFGRADGASLLGGLLGLGRSGARARAHDPAIGKGWINELLESNPIPAIWVCNSLDAMDPAYLRRFDIVLEMRTPPHSVRRGMVERYFGNETITPACAERLAAVEQLQPATIEQAARVIQTLEEVPVEQRDAATVRLIEDKLQAMGVQARVPRETLPAHYDPAFINADRDLGNLVDGLKSNPSARLCLYGPPGTGKTAFAHHLGRRLDMPVVTRRGADLLGMYVGETEKAIAAAFQSARDADAILLIDEADSFLRDRTRAGRSWEVTQVNELLTRMECFDGIFIASTNHMGSLDAAAMRRFDIKSCFDYLREAQRRMLLARICGSDINALDDRAVRRLDTLDRITPGDFANTLRQLRVLGEPTTPARVIELLAGELAHKPDGGHRPIGFTA